MSLCRTDWCLLDSVDQATKRCILGNDCLVSSFPTSHSSSSSSNRDSFCLQAASFGLHSSTVKHTACHTPASGNSSDCNNRCLNNHRAGCSSNTIANMWLSVLQQDSRWQLLSLRRDIDCNVRSGQLLRCLGQSYASLLSMLGRCTCIMHVMN